MTTVVLLVFSDAHKEVVDDSHVHGLRKGQLLIASGAPGAGLDAQVVRTVPVAELAVAETCERHDAPETESASGSGWSMVWPER